MVCAGINRVSIVSYVRALFRFSDLIRSLLTIYNRGGVKITMKLKTTLRIAAASLGLMAAALVPAIAGPFATFNQTGINPTPFVFTNTGATSSFTLVTAVIPVDFTYSVANGYGPTGVNIPAVMSFSATVSGTGFDFGGIAVQGMTLNSLVITADVPSGGFSNLLTVNGNGILDGIYGGTTASMAGDTSVGQTVNYTSDFLNFAGNNAYNLAFVLKNTTPLKLAGNSYLKTFKASGTGNFSSDEQSFGVPEPSTSTAFLFGGLAVLGLIAFGRKTRAGSIAS